MSTPRPPCPGCGASAFVGRDGAFCSDDCRDRYLLRPSADAFEVSDDEADAAEARRLMGVE
jgi:endogenous inhibitor of DNA gyrase (YacG/DUF329 family)